MNAMNSLTDVELIARQHINERTHHRHHLPRRPHAGRTRVADALRRVADRLDHVTG